MVRFSDRLPSSFPTSSPLSIRNDPTFLVDTGVDNLIPPAPVLFTSRIPSLLTLLCSRIPSPKTACMYTELNGVEWIAASVLEVGAS